MKSPMLILSFTLAGVAVASETTNRLLIDGFSIDQTEVTVAQFKKFAASTNYQTKAEKDGGGYEWGAGREQRPAMPAGVNGLYQMGGNLWEWGLDKQGQQRITLGGSWWYGAGKSQRSGFQYKPIDFAAMYIGFRCVYPIQSESK